MKRYGVAIFGVLATLGVVAISSNAWADSSVNVALWNDGSDMALKLDKNTVPAGKVTFKGTNTSVDDTVHEMLVIKVESKLPKLPYDEDTLRVPEGKIDSLGEIGEINAGDKGALTIDMKPGTYLLFCNQPGHYAANMKTIFYVK